jgi:plasmid replication initiation protein
VKENSSDTLQEKPQNQPLDSAVDELNLAEFPLAAISDRFLDGTKTVVLEDTVFDREQNKYLPRRLTLSGSDRYGLPTSKDDDVLLACIQLSRLNDFATREVSFSRYEILRLLGWADESRNYERVATSLRRWKGLSIFPIERSTITNRRVG